MINGRTIGVVIPAYNEEKQIGKVVRSIPDFVDRIVVVDDGSTDRTVEAALRHRTDDRLADRLFVLKRENNRGVGRAIAEGYKWMLARQVDIAAVMAGDGQMDPRELPKIVRPVVDGEVDYVKGSRRLKGSSWRKIPKERLVGNAILSVLTRIVSGYWSIIDSQSGYTAISARALKALDLDRIYDGYGVPNDILTKLNICGLRIAQVAIEPVYNVGEQSKMKVGRIVFPILKLLLRLFFSRIFARYAAVDLHPIIFFYLLAIALLVLGSAGAVASLALDLAQAFRIALDIGVLRGWMPAFEVTLLFGLNLLLLSMWMDMDENKHLQINLPDERIYDEVAIGETSDRSASAP